jgi:hypothetical protein
VNRATTGGTSVINRGRSAQEVEAAIEWAVSVRPWSLSSESELEEWE